jgi:hypothetical protein
MEIDTVVSEYFRHEHTKSSAIKKSLASSLVYRMTIEELDKVFKFEEGSKDKDFTEVRCTIR